MKNFKKVIAGALALLMLALSVNVTFAAENYTEKEAIVVAKVNAAGIMTGTDKGFEPSKTLTRAEAAAIFVRMKGISEDTVKQNATTTLFTDVAASHWAAGYVNVASNYGIIKGVGANKFAPEKEVSVAEFYTMAIRLLNAGQLVEAEGTWPTNYVNFAIEHKLADDVAQIYTATSTRMTAATIVANTLAAKTWNKTSYVNNGEITFTEGGTTVLDSLHIEEKEAQTIEITDSKKLKATVTAYGANTKFNERAGLANAKKGLSYTVWYNTEDDEVVGFWLPKDNKTVEFTEIKSFAQGGDIKLVVNGEETKYKADAAAKIILNEGSELTALPSTTLPMFGIAYYGTADTNKDKIVKIYAESYTSWGVVKEIKSNTIKFESFSGSNASNITIKTDDDSNYVYRVTKNGKEASINDIEAGDVLFIHTNGTSTSSHDYTINVYEDTVTGKVSAKSGSKVTVDGKKYDLKGSVSVNAGDEGTLYLSENGKVVMFEAEKKTSEVLMVSAMRLVKSNLVDGKNVLEIKYTTMDGQLVDWTEVNAKDSDSTKRAELGTWATDQFTGLTYASLGNVYEFEKKSGKIVLKANGTGSDQEITNITKYTDGDVVTLTTGLGKYFLSDDVVAYEVESNKKTGADEEKTLKVINVEDLDTITTTGYAVDLDTAQKQARVIILNSTNIKADKDWAVVLDVATYDDGDDDTDEDTQVTVLYAGEDEVTYLIAKKSDLLFDDNDDQDPTNDVYLAAGDVCEFSVADGKIKSVKESLDRADNSNIVNKVSSTDKYLTKEYNNGVIGYGAYTAASWTSASVKNAAAIVEADTLVFASDVIYAYYDGTDYKIPGDDDTLKFLDIRFGSDPTSDTEATSFNTDNLDGVSEIVKLVTFTEDNETKVIAVIYQNN